MKKFMSLTKSHDEGDGSSNPVSDHTVLGAIASTRSPKRLTCISLNVSGLFL